MTSLAESTARDKTDLWRSGELLFRSDELGLWRSDGRISIEPGSSLTDRCQFQADLEGAEAMIRLSLGEGDSACCKPRKRGHHAHTHADDSGTFACPLGSACDMKDGAA